ncbi:MAG: hypothetical protein GF398_17845 [Chitinivibrionales bacterium]|nr:hypothetical protein [Chitinivibrionales bacterium]
MQHHVIKQSILNFLLEHRSGAFDLQERFSRLHEERIVPILDEICTKNCAPDDYIKIDRLEIDLGTISSMDFEEELEQAITRTFEERLRDRIDSVRLLPRTRSAEASPAVDLTFGTGSDDARADEIEDASVRALKLVEHFLKYGTLPWWAPEDSAYHLDEVLDECVNRSAHDTAHMLREAMRFSSCRQRLILQFSNASMSAVVRLLASGPVRAIVALALEVTGNRVLSPAGFSPPQRVLLAEAINRDLLDALAGQQESQTIIAEACRIVSRHVAYHSDTTVGETVPALHEQLASSPLSASLKRQITAGLELVQAAQDASSTLDSNLQEVVRQSERKSGEEARRTSQDAQSDDVASSSRNKDLLWPGGQNQSESLHAATEKKRPLSQMLEDYAHGARPAAPESEPIAEPDEMYLRNAGLVLLWPYLSSLFERCGYLEGTQFKDAESTVRAMHLLHFAATGAQEPVESELALNKLLCNWHESRPVPKRLELSDVAKSETEDLLKAAIDNWSALKSTSVDGLRTSFLQRNGIAQKKDAGRLVRVERKSYDMLLEKLPWGMSIITLPWLEGIIHVEW